MVTMERRRYSSLVAMDSILGAYRTVKLNCTSCSTQYIYIHFMSQKPVVEMNNKILCKWLYYHGRSLIFDNDALTGSINWNCLVYLGKKRCTETLEFK